MCETVLKLQTQYSNYFHNVESLASGFPAFSLNSACQWRSPDSMCV